MIPGLTGVWDGSRLSKYSGERAGPKVTLLRDLLEGCSRSDEMGDVFAIRLRGDGDENVSSNSGTDISDDLRVLRSDDRREHVESFETKDKAGIKGEAPDSSCSGMGIRDVDVELDVRRDLRVRGKSFKYENETLGESWLGFIYNEKE